MREALRLDPGTGVGDPDLQLPRIGLGEDPGADAEFPRNAMDGARQVIKRLGMKIVYDKTYPPATTD